MSIILTVLVGFNLLVVTGLTIYICYSNKQLKKLALPATKVDDKVLEHIVYTRTTLNGIMTGDAFIAALLTFLGVHEYSHIEAEIQKGVKAEGDTIRVGVEEDTKDLLAIDITGLKAKRDSIMEVTLDVMNQKEQFDKAYGTGILRSTHLRRLVTEQVFEALGPMQVNRALDRGLIQGNANEINELT